MTFDYHSQENNPNNRRITPLGLARALYAMEGILIEYGVKSYEELQERYPDVFHRFINSLPELTPEEKEQYKPPRRNTRNNNLNNL